MAAFPVLGDVALTVSDLTVRTPWYRNLLGTDPILDEDAGAFWHVAFVLPGGTLLGLHQFSEGAAGERFNKRRAGLDHISFVCSKRAELEMWRERLDEVGIVHGDIVDASCGSGPSFRDPDNIAREFFVPPEDDVSKSRHTACQAVDDRQSPTG